MDYETKWKHINKVIPEKCNVVRGMLGPELEGLICVGVRTEEGIEATTPLYNVEPIIDNYWEMMEAGATFVIAPGTTDMVCYKWDGVGWIKQNASLGVAAVKNSGPKILTLADVIK
jgi:hypothetical protein